MAQNAAQSAGHPLYKKYLDELVASDKTTYDNAYFEELHDRHWRTFGSAVMEGDEDPEGDSDDPDDDDDPEGGDGGEDSDADDKDGRDPQKKIKAQEEEIARHRKRRLEAEKRAEENEKKLKQLLDKDKAEVDVLKEKVESYEKDLGATKQELKDLRLQNAFLSDNTFDWRKPGQALKLIDLSDVEIDDDGKVTGLDKALKDLAKDSPHLLKSATNDDDGNESSNSSSSKPPKTSGGTSNRRTKERTDAKTREAELLRKNPGLRR